MLSDLCAAKIVRLRAADVRYANLDPSKPFIASIKILPPGSQPVN
jgi:hypothetical protein